jgi:predicted RNA-binding protein YlqC (UPF0109 family)
MDAEYVDGDINTISGNDNYDDHDGNDNYDDHDDNDAADEGNAVKSELPEAVLTYLAKSLANDPEAVVVEAEDRRGQIRLSLHVGPGDMGRVIGRRGRTAQAIRALVGVAGARSGVATNVDIVDD